MINDQGITSILMSTGAGAYDNSQSSYRTTNS